MSMPEFATLNYVVEHYDVPAVVGMRVRDTRGRDGTVLGGVNAHVAVRLDGEEHWGSYHPLSLDYLDGVAPDDRLAERNARIAAWNDRINGRVPGTGQETTDGR